MSYNHVRFAYCILCASRFRRVRRHQPRAVELAGGACYVCETVEYQALEGLRRWIECEAMGRFTFALTTYLDDHIDRARSQR